MDGLEIAVEILADGERIEREKQNLALTEDEARTVKAAAFLRVIAPYLVAPDAGDQLARGAQESES